MHAPEQAPGALVGRDDDERALVPARAAQPLDEDADRRAVVIDDLGEVDVDQARAVGEDAAEGEPDRRSCSRPRRPATRTWQPSSSWRSSIVTSGPPSRHRALPPSPVTTIEPAIGPLAPEAAVKVWQTSRRSGVCAGRAGSAVGSGRPLCDAGRMVSLTRIYTRTGDDGTTALGDLSRTRKTDRRLAAYADANEANAALGVAVACGGLSDDVRAVLLRVQNDLFDVGADTLDPAPGDRLQFHRCASRKEWVAELEADCDRYLEPLEKLRSFILPGGTPGSAHLHHALTVVRRAEALDVGSRRVRHRAGHQAGHGGVNPLVATYLNRLSDLLFVLARTANVGAGGDVLGPRASGQATPHALSLAGRTPAPGQLSTGAQASGRGRLSRR